MKRILISIMTIALVSALVAGGIYAGFFDTEEGDIEFRAGTIDLTVDGRSETWTLAVDKMVPDLDQEEPDAGDHKSFVLRNIGTLAGHLGIKIDDPKEEVRGIPGTASGGDDSQMTASLDDNPDIDKDEGFWTGYYLHVSEKGTLLVTGFTKVEDVLTFTVGGEWVANPLADDVFYLQTEHERASTAGDYDKDLKDYLKVALLVEDKNGDWHLLDPDDNSVAAANVDALEPEDYTALSAWDDAEWNADTLGAGFVIDSAQQIAFRAYWWLDTKGLTEENVNQLQGAVFTAKITLRLDIPANG